jgi:hypothetical protein
MTVAEFNRSVESVAKGYPDANPKAVVGATKPAVHVIPPVAVLKMGQAMADGKNKYGLLNWRTNVVAASVYYDAAMRHLFAWWDGQDAAEDSGVDHLAHVAACMAILMDAKHCQRLKDDRPMPGPTAAFIKANTQNKV